MLSAAYDAAGKKVDPWGNKIKAMCDKGALATDGDGPAASRGLIQSGEGRSRDLRTEITGVHQRVDQIFEKLGEIACKPNLS